MREQTPLSKISREVADHKQGKYVKCTHADSGRLENALLAACQLQSRLQSTRGPCNVIWSDLQAQEKHKYIKYLLLISITAHAIRKFPAENHALKMYIRTCIEYNRPPS